MVCIYKLLSNSMNPMNIHFEYNILYFHSKIIKKKSILAQKEDKLIVGGLERPSYAKISSTKSMEPVKKMMFQSKYNVTNNDIDSHVTI